MEKINMVKEKEGNYGMKKKAQVIKIYKNEQAMLIKDKFSIKSKEWKV